MGVEDFEKKYFYGRFYIIVYLELKNFLSIGLGGFGKFFNFEVFVNVFFDVIIVVFISKE